MDKPPGLRMLHLPPRTVRLRLTLLYGGLFLVSGVVLLAIMYLLFRQAGGVNLIVSTGPRQGSASSEALNHATQLRATNVVRRTSEDLHQGLLRAGIALAIMTVVSIALGWLVAGRVLRPLRAMTASTRQISERNLNERLALSGPSDELKDLADTIDGLLARLEAHVAEQQRFAANASHELRTPLALTQTLLDVARKDPNHDDVELVDRLREVNTRAIDLTEALLLLSRADQRSFTRKHIDLSLMAEEANETLLASRRRARRHDRDLRGDDPHHRLRGAAAAAHDESRAQRDRPQSARGGHRMDHDQRAARRAWCSPSRTPARSSPRSSFPLLDEPFQRGISRIRTDHAGVGLGLAIAKSITQAHDGTLTLTPRIAGGLRVTVVLPAAPGH